MATAKRRICHEHVKTIPKVFSLTHLLRLHVVGGEADLTTGAGGEVDGAGVAGGGGEAADSGGYGTGHQPTGRGLLGCVPEECTTADGRTEG